MKKKELRKGMKRFIDVQSAYENVDRNGRDLIFEKEGKIVDIADVLALQLKEFMNNNIQYTSKKVGGVSGMNINEFKDHFIASDEDFKITMLYGVLNKNADLKKLKEEYMLSFKGDRGFRLLDEYYYDVEQGEIVDESELFEEFIQAEKEEEKEKKRWSEEVKDAKKFNLSDNIPLPEEKTPRKQRIYMTARTKFEKIGAVYYEDEKAVDVVRSRLTKTQLQEFDKRLDKQGSGYVYKLISSEDMKLDYEVLKTELMEAQSAFAKDPSAENKLRVDTATLKMQKFKGEVSQMSRTYEKMKSPKIKYTTKEKYKAGGSPLTKAEFVKEKKEYANLQYNKAEREKRGLLINKEGNMVKKYSREDDVTSQKDRDTHDKGILYRQQARIEKKRHNNAEYKLKRSILNEYVKQDKYTDLIKKTVYSNTKYTKEQKLQGYNIKNKYRDIESKFRQFENEYKHIVDRRLSYRKNFTITPSLADKKEAREYTIKLRQLAQSIIKKQETDKGNKQHAWNRKNKAKYVKFKAATAAYNELGKMSDPSTPEITYKEFMKKTRGGYKGTHKVQSIRKVGERIKKKSKGKRKNKG